MTQRGFRLDSLQWTVTGTTAESIMGTLSALAAARTVGLFEIM
jgi:hypothetical protein